MQTYDKSTPSAPLPRPSLSDNGHTVTLDLHGASVDEAVRLVEALIVQAARHGRATVKIIHGTSTSESGERRTIKNAVRRHLADGDYDRHVASSHLDEGSILLGLAPAPRPTQRALRLSDLE